MIQHGGNYNMLEELLSKLDDYDQLQVYEAIEAELFQLDVFYFNLRGDQTPLSDIEEVNTALTYVKQKIKELHGYE